MNMLSYSGKINTTLYHLYVYVRTYVAMYVRPCVYVHMCVYIRMYVHMNSLK